ncbi:MAG TPA: RagB/SusD family nutrient uptake outer membrane protein [Gemmatimonadales bacterium]|nr:RagB/SusD family nutrient uptake outer membrane protein [Gemmatimonadales bacterium]
MNRTIKIAGVAALLLTVAGSGCTDPTVAPKSTVTSANIFNDPNSYRAFLAKIYGGLIVTGQRGPDGNPDIGGIDEGFGEYLRLYWYLQEMPTDEAVIGWNDPGLPDLNTGTWGASNSMVNAMYYRVFYQVMLVNEFLRQSTDAKLDSRGQIDPTLRTNVHFYRAEARFLRALSYWHGLDLFANIPLVTENDPLGSTPPKQATRAAIYAYVLSELNAIISQLPPKGASTYGRATPETAHMLLAKLYLNAGVYTGTTNYPGAVSEAQAVIAGGYTLDPSFVHNFQADNNTSLELVFVAPQDGAKTQTWGGMTFLVHAGCGGSMKADSSGIDYCWGGYRMKQQIYRSFALADGRGSFFYKTGQTDSVSDRGDFTKGIAAPKFTNRTSGGGAGAQKGMVDTDFPIFRLADAYLIYVEANIRGGGGTAATALGYLNAIRQRAYGNTSANFAALPPVDTILAERGRELMFEAQRRTDLVRFGVFSGGTYLWAWKGGTAGGTAIPASHDLYPLPANELIANPNLKQNPGY